MLTGVRDARLRELMFLSALNREGPLYTDPAGFDPFMRQMVTHLLNEGYLNGVGALTPSGDAWNSLDQRLANARQHDIHCILNGTPLTLAINHKGRVRLGELEQELLTGRDLDPFGIVLNKRHVLKDLTIAILNARAEEPLSVAYLDLNGLKQVNDTRGHQAGDELLKTYLKTVVSLMGERSEAYRDGGDEVVVIMPSTGSVAAEVAMNGLLRQLQREWVEGLGSITASCGIATTQDPSLDAKELLERADGVQRRAKKVSRAHLPRPSVLALERSEPTLVATAPDSDSEPQDS
jgi:diguanylate cyclase (GGDEF)-like protein